MKLDYSKCNKTRTLEGKCAAHDLTYICAIDKKKCVAYSGRFIFLKIIKKKIYRLFNNFFYSVYYCPDENTRILIRKSLLQKIIK